MSRRPIEAGLTGDQVSAVMQHVTEALLAADSIRSSKVTEVSYETLQRAAFRRKDGWRRPYTLADARRESENIARRLRSAWEILDPCLTPTRESLSPLATVQQQFQIAISHLDRVLNQCRNAAEQQEADTAARDWLESIQ